MKDRKDARKIRSVQSNVRSLAFYLPQYHPIPENNEWWGEGFTEWTNVSKARPLFPGHYQPHVPADLGYYDLRMPETRQAQADLARSYGIYGFCYYHYWFKGRRLLERPFDEVLLSGRPDFPFCLCWANEIWTRAWDGRSGEILMDQNYSREDDLQHIRWLVNAFRDERYIRIEGRPLILIYRAGNLPNPYRTASAWRKEARKLGIQDLYLCKVESFANEHSDPEEIGFDASVEFQPDWTNLGPGVRGGVHGDHLIYSYSDIVDRMIAKKSPPYKRFPCVTPSWDNSPRRKKNSLILRGSTPELYEVWLEETIKRLESFDPEERIIFINAWNEWGEGNHLEPDARFGHSYLEATRRCLFGTGSDETAPDDRTDQDDGDHMSGIEEILRSCKMEGKEMSNPACDEKGYMTALEEVLARSKRQGFSPQLSVETGEICFSLGLIERSKYFFEKALSGDPNNSDALNNLGVVSFQSGDIHTARDYFNSAIRANPGNNDARKNLVAVQEMTKGGGGSEIAGHSGQSIYPAGGNGSKENTGALTRHEERNNGGREKPSELITTEIDSYDNYKKHASKMQVVYERRQQYEKNLMKDTNPFPIEAYCYICRQKVQYSVSFVNPLNTQGAVTANWRERVICPGCGMNSRKIASMHLFEQLFRPQTDSKIYICEQTTAVFKWLSSHYSDVTGSEYLGKAVPFGTTNEKGVRNEDLTALSFSSDRFDYILSFDVFEHVPDFQKAFRESLRVLKPGGSLFFTVPFVLNSEKNIVHAIVNENNEIEHIHPPRYHGDPLKKEGCLAFYHFGWEMLNQLRETGFTNVEANLYWSDEFGYLGCEQVMFSARKPLLDERPKDTQDLHDLMDEKIAEGEDLVKNGRLDEANIYFKKLLGEINQLKGTLMNDIAVIQIYKGETGKAEKLLNEAIKIGYGAAEARKNLEAICALNNTDSAGIRSSDVPPVKTDKNSPETSMPKKKEGCLYCQFDPVTLEPLNENTKTRVRESFLLEYDFTNKTVLDIGSNLGLFSLIAAKRGAAKVTGVDITEDFIRQSSETAGVYSGNLPQDERARFRVSFIRAGFSDLDPSVYRADVVLFYEVIHWLTAQGIPITQSIRKVRELTRQDLLIEFPWDVTERSITAQTKLTRDQYDAEIIVRELLKHFEHVRIIRFAEYMNDTMAKRALIHAR